MLKPRRLTVSDNPHKPGTSEHHNWEYWNIHMPRMMVPDPEAVQAADERLARLREQLKLTPEQQALEDLLAEVREATGQTEPAGPTVTSDDWTTYTFTWNYDDGVYKAATRLHPWPDNGTSGMLGLARTASWQYDDLYREQAQRLIHGKPAGKVRYCHHRNVRGQCRDCSKGKK